MNREVLIVCESIYHANTEKIAKTMALKMKCQVVSCEEATSMNLEGYKYIGIGSGIYFKSHHPKLFEFIKRLNNKQQVFIYSTHGAPYLGKYHVPLKEALKKQGVFVIGEFSCRGFDCTGPYNIVGGGNKGKPNEKDQYKAGKFIARLLPQYFKDTGTVHNGKNVEIRENECVRCGRCCKVCPMEVFEMRNNMIAISKLEDCIHCNLCTEQCPKAAISIQHSWREEFAIAKRHSKKSSL